MGFDDFRDNAVQFFKKFFRIGELEDPNHQKREILLLSNARGGNISGVVMALDTGANPNAQEPETGKTALHYAVEKNMLPLVEILRDRGARGDICDTLTGSTPLMIATENNYQRIIKALIAGEHNGINIKDREGRSIINMALAIGKDKVANYFVDMGADAQASVKWALENDSEPQLMWLIKHGATPDVLDGKGYSPLMRAVIERNVEEVNKWLSRGANPNWTEGGGELVANRGKTPLMVAVQQKDEHIARILILQPGIDLNVTDLAGETALMKAVRLLLNETCQLLVERGADHTLVSNDGMNLLIAACQTNEVEVVKAVWELGGLNANQATNNGWTPLMFAANHGNVKMVEFLLGNGSEPSFRSPTLKITALDLARKTMASSTRDNPHLKKNFEYIIELLVSATTAA